MSPSSRISPFGPDVWHALWGMKLQARWKHLLWKIAWNLLPFRANISRFVTVEDPNTWLCPFCHNTLETLGHIFLECDLARNLWRNSPWPLNLANFATRPLSDWVKAIVFPSDWLLVPKSDSQKFQIFASLNLDFIWQARNKLIHDAIEPDPVKAISCVSSNLNFHVAAWKEAAIPSLWSPPGDGSIKGNFDVVVRGSFAVAAAVLSDYLGNIISAGTLYLHYSDALLKEAAAALLIVRLAVSMGVSCFNLEGDALLIILAINHPSLFSSWSFANVISDISLDLDSFQSWNALKVSRCDNYRAHGLAKWAASHHVYGSILIGPPILSSLRIKGGKNPPL